MAGGELTVLQYNVHISNSGFDAAAKRTLKSQVRRIRGLVPQPDVIAFQELYIRSAQRAYAAAFADEYEAHSALLAAPTWCDQLNSGKRCASPWHVRYFPSLMFCAIAIATQVGLRAPLCAFTAFWLVQAFVPAAVTAQVASFCMLLAATYAMAPERGATAIVPSLMVLSLAFIPCVLPRVLAHAGIVRALLGVISGDSLGLLVLVRRHCSACSVVATTAGMNVGVGGVGAAAGAAAAATACAGAGSAVAHRFSHQAVDFRPVGLIHLVNSWFNATFLHRGVLMVPIEMDVMARPGGSGGRVRVLVATSHLQTGVTNPRRPACVQELRDALIASARSTQCAAIVLAMDANADGAQPEMKWLRGSSGGFTDTWLAAGESGTGKNKRGITWDNNNPLTAGNLTEPDQRVDFVFIAQAPGADAGGALLPTRCAVVLDEPPCDSDHYGVLATLQWSQ